MSTAAPATPARPAPPPAWSSGDHGLGLCLPCLGEAAADQHAAAEARRAGHVPAAGRVPAFAITTAPQSVPVIAPDGTLAGITAVPVPTCWRHLTQQAAGPRRQLLIAPPGARV